MPAPRKPANEDERLASLRALDLLDTAAEQAYDDIARLASQIAGTPSGLITLIDAERQWFKARHNHTVAQTPRDISFCAHAILSTDGPTVVEDARLDPRFADNPDVLGGAGIRFYAGAPLVTPGGAALGTLCVFDKVPRKLDPEQVAALSALARVVMELIDKRLALRALSETLADISREPAASGRMPGKHVLRDIVHVAAMQPATLGKVGERLGGEIAGDDTASRLANYARSGFGDVRELAPTSSGLRVFEASGLFELKPGSRQSACRFTAGFLRGLVSRETGAGAACEEVACESRGDQRCRFVVRTLAGS